MAGIFLKLGTVRAQKSSMLLNTAHRYEDKGDGVLCLKPETDTRDVGEIRSRNGLSRPCVTLKKDDNLVKIVRETIEQFDKEDKSLAVIMIDEGQFLSNKNVMDILFVSRYFPILIYGLKSDYKGFTWDSIGFLSNFAKDEEEIKNPCQYCSSLAKLNLRLVNGKAITEGESVSVDETLGESEFVPVCPKCYTERTYFKDVFEEYEDLGK